MAVPKQDRGRISGKPGGVTINVLLQPKQREWLDMFEAGVRHPGYGGAKGGGKSYSARAIQVIRRLKYENSVGLILRREYKKLYANHILKLLQEYPIIAKNDWFNKSDGIVSFPNGSKLFFGHSEHELDIMNYIGIEFDDVIIEQAEEFTEFQFDQLNSCVRTTNPAISPALGISCNPGGIGHQWIKRKWIDRAFTDDEDPNDYAFIQAFVRDNQALMQADLKYVKALNTIKDPMIRKAYLDGDWDIYPDQFFDGWNKQVIEVEPFEIPSSWLLFGALDYGETQPTSFGIYAIDHEKNVYRAAEYYQSNRSGTQHARGVKATIDSCGLISGRRVSTILADPSMWTKRRVNERHVFAPIDEFVRAGLHCVPANNNRENGWMLCRNSIAEKRFHYFKGLNPNFARTVPAMPRSKSNPEDVDTKSEDHAGDEWRYVMSHIYKPHRDFAPETYSQFTGSTVLKSVRALNRPKTRFAPIPRYV